MNNMNFVRTSDPATAESLRGILHEIPMEGKDYVFVNDPTIRFDNRIDNSKITYTNKMCI